MTMRLSIGAETDATRILVNPSDEELEAERRRSHLHPLMIDDLRGTRRHPKFTRYERHLWLSLWDSNAASDPSVIESEITLIFNTEELLVVQRGEGTSLRDLGAILTPPPPDTARSPVVDVHRVLDAIVSDFVDLGAGIEDELDEVESEVFDTRVREDYTRIYSLRKRIGRIDRAASALASALREAGFEIHAATESEPELRICFRHLENDASGVAELAAAQHTALDAVVSSHESNVATRQNQDMRTISAFAALLALPTVIASFYGMNFPHLPWLHTEYGWILATGLMVVLDVVALVVFRLRGWIGHSRKREGAPGDT